MQSAGTHHHVLGPPGIYERRVRWQCLCSREPDSTRRTKTASAVHLRLSGQLQRPRMQGHHAGIEPLLMRALSRSCAGLCVHMCFGTSALQPTEVLGPCTHIYNTQRHSTVRAGLHYMKTGVQDMFSKAKHPERVFVGSVQQLATDIEEACWRPGKPATPAI